MERFRVWALLSGVLVACGGSTHDTTAETPSGAICPANNELTYDTFGRAFMTNYCIRCHSSNLQGAARQRAPVGHDVDTVGAVLAVAEHIDEHAAAGPTVINRETPPTGPFPSDEERHRLGQCLACEIAKKIAGVRSRNVSLER